jgi:hypothetical protein
MPLTWISTPPVPAALADEHSIGFASGLTNLRPPFHEFSQMLSEISADR